MTYQVRNLAVAVALAALAGLLTVLYVTGSKHEQKQKAAPVTVLVAARDIAPGTTGAELAHRGYLKPVAVGYDAVASGAVKQTSALAGLVVQQQIYKGEEITARRFTAASEQGLRGEVRGRFRVLDLAGDPQQVLSGTLQAGDRVDVVGTWTQPEGSQRHVSGIVARGLRVLAAPTGSGSSGLSGNGASSAVKLALTDQEAQRLFWLAKNGEWTLELRPASGARDSAPSLDTARTLLPPANAR